ncbi:hypothetical protein F4009_22315 [Candidatus Poribacteria bacterium]|nr:hypothetical protein [Candidatus Poribacteria bacterium]MYH82467.1 hypothetical protein [Candidatus Poribacteria bacterium]MYK96695.1 hypothetical protein [Candidatus Poribacteria bacterium]
MGTKTDKSVFAVTGTTLLTFLIASRIGTIWILYPNVLIAVSLFFYCNRQTDEDTSLLSSSSIFGLATVLTYVPMDWLFSRKVRLIVYRSDFLVNITTPIPIILNWVVFATLAAYCYQRLTAICQIRFASDAENPSGGSIGIAMLAAGVTGIGAALGSVIIYALGALHLWEWNALKIDRIPQIASVPTFVPIAFLITFLLCPYFFGIANSFLREQHAGVAGIRCGIFIGALQFLSFLLFYI